MGLCSSFVFQVVIMPEIISLEFALGHIPAAAFSSVLGFLLSSGPWLHPLQAGSLCSLEKQPQPLVVPGFSRHCCCVTPWFRRVFSCVYTGNNTFYVHQPP